MGIFKDFADAMDKMISKIDDNAEGKNGIRGYTFSLYHTSFICPHCLKSILMEKITSITCPYCDTTSDNRVGFFLFCPSCHSKIKYFTCPYCKEGIDLDAPYNHKELEEKRNV